MRNADAAPSLRSRDVRAERGGSHIAGRARTARHRIRPGQRAGLRETSKELAQIGPSPRPGGAMARPEGRSPSSTGMRARSGGPGGITLRRCATPN